MIFFFSIVIASDRRERGNPGRHAQPWIASSALPPRNDAVKKRGHL